MGNPILLDYKTILDTNREKLFIGLKKYYPEDNKIDLYVKEINRIYEDKLENISPYIMVYGIYNAGKSSIINELLGRDEAIVNDKPETDSINEYMWNGYTIADTPGVGAPIEHENVTTDHLRKADIILFVMSSTGSNEKADNYRRLKEIIDQGKKVIIVLNDKNGDLGQHDDQLALLKLKVQKNMEAFHINAQDYTITIVNAKRAQTGRIKGSETLIEKSNINELKHIILSELKKTNDYFVINNAIADIVNQINCIQEHIESFNNDKELESLKILVNKIRAIKGQMKSNMRDFINNKIQVILPSIENDIWSNRENEEQINNVLKGYTERLISDITKEFNEQITIVNQDIVPDIAEVNRDLEKRITVLENNKIARLSIDTSDSGKNSSIEFSNTDLELENLNAILAKSQQLIDTYNKDKSVIPLIAIGLGMEAGEVGAIATTLAKTPIGSAILSSISSILPTTVSTTLGTAMAAIAPYLAPAIGVAYVISKIFSGGSSQSKLEAEVDAYNEREQQRIVALNNARNDLHTKLGYAFDSLSTDVQQQINLMVDEILGNYEELYSRKISESEDFNVKYNTIMKLISDNLRNYNELSVMLRSNS